jgi:hypothetical protein
MKSRNLIILTVLVIVVGGFIWFYERHQPTTEEARERQDRVFPTFEGDDIRQLEITNSHGHFRFAKVGENWRLSEPMDCPADSTAISSLLNSLGNLEEKRKLAPDEVDPAAYGLDEAELEVVAIADDGRRYRLKVGEETPLGSNRAVQRDDEGGVLLVASWIVNDLDKELDDWRSRDVVEVLAKDVASLQVVTSDGDRIQVVQEGELWRLLEPVEDLADRDQVRNLVSDLNGLRIEEFVDAPSDLAELGLAEPAFRVNLVRGGDDGTVTLDLGATREREGAEQVACRRDGEDVFWVRDDVTTRLAKAPVRWRANRVLPFDTWDVEVLEITRGEETVALERREGLWRTEGGEEVDYSAVQERLGALANLEVREYDLLKPVTDSIGRVELELKAQEEGGANQRAEFVFYPALSDGGDALATVSMRDTVMSVDPAEVEAILEEPGGLITPEEPEQSEKTENTGAGSR